MKNLFKKISNLFNSTKTKTIKPPSLENLLKISHFRSAPPQSPFAPTWSYIISDYVIDDINFDEIASIILKKEKEIIEKYPPFSRSESVKDAFTGVGPNSMTSRWKSYNMFHWTETEMEKLQLKIRELYLSLLNDLNIPRSRVWIQCWTNVLRTGEKMTPHIHATHPWCYLGGHIVVQCEDTSTVYINPVNQINDPEEFISKNEVGKFTLFSNHVPHYTTTHLGSKERITIAFDIIPEPCLHWLEETDNLVFLDDPNLPRRI